MNKSWEAESDAHTIAEAEEIKADSKRFVRAAKAAKGLAAKKQKQASAMKKVARKAPPKKAAKTSTKNRRKK